MRFDPDSIARAPEHLFLLQELVEHDPARGIIRLELVGGELLYAMRVVTHGRFNLCPSPISNPDDGSGACEVPSANARPVEFYPFTDAPPEAVEIAKAIAREAQIDVGAVEYLETPDGRRVFYDVNAKLQLAPERRSALRVWTPSIASWTSSSIECACERRISRQSFAHSS